MLTFDRPLALLALPLVLAALWAIARRSGAGLSPGSQRVALAVRAVVTTLLVLALAGAHLVKRSDRLTTLFLLDVSHSIRPDQRAQGLDYIRRALAAKGRDDQAGVIVFGRTAFLADAPSDTLQELGGVHASVAGDATDLSGALRLAQGAFPSDTGRKIVLLSDGDENIGDAQAQIDALRSDGVRVDVAPTALGLESGGVASPEALVESVDLPPRVRASAPFTVRAVVSSTVGQSATLTWRRDGQPLATQSVTLSSGKNAFSLAQKVAQTGYHRYDALLTPARDSIAENNHAYGMISVQGRPRVLYVTDARAPGAGSLPRAMAGQDIDLVTRAPGAVPATVAELASYDSVVLSDVPAGELGPGQMAALETAVKQFGVGLGMVGGPNSFGAGQYGGTPVEAALPVKMDVRDQRRLPQAAVVVVLDASGSMAATEDGVEKVQLGARAAVQLMGALQPDDQVAVTAVTETTTVVVPLEDSSKAQSAKVAIESVHAGGGGIFCRTGLSDAYALLLESHAPIRHVILCADTSDSEQQDDCVAMAQDMLRQHHISTTVCGIGHPDDQHVPFQRALARAGHGQLFIVNQAADLPRLFERDVQTIQQSWFIEKPILPQAAPVDDVLAGVPFSQAPPLLGYDLTTLKPGASLGLSAPGQNDPLFAHWRYGLGRTWAFTSDDRAHWAARWLGWPGYTEFWAQALRWSLRSNAATDFQTALSDDGGRGHVTVDALSSTGSFANGASLTAHVVAPDLSVSPVPLTQTAPGRYEGRFNTDQTGAYLVNVSRPSPSLSSPAPPLLGAGGATPSQTVGLVIPYSPEYRTLGPNLPLLSSLTDGTGGKIQPDPAQVFRDAPDWVSSVVDLSPALLLLTTLLFLADIAVRRLALRPAQVRASAARGVAAVQSGLAAAQKSVSPQPPAPITAPQVDRLLTRPLAVRAPTLDDRKAPPESLLSRRAGPNAPADDNPFPQVASLARKPTALPPPIGDDYSGRLLDAKRRVQERDD